MVHHVHIEYHNMLGPLQSTKYLKMGTYVTPVTSASCGFKIPALENI